MPSCAVQTAVSVEAAPHQIRSRRPGRVRLQAQQAGRVGEHRPRVRLGEALALQELEEDLGVAARHVGIRLTFGGLVAEVAEAIDHLLGRAATDPELQAAAGDQIGRPGVLGHVERVLVAHVDDGGAHLDPLRPRTDRGEERERGAELPREVVDAEVRAIGAELLGRDGQLDRLEQGVGRRTHLRVRRIGPVAERQEPDALHRCRLAPPARARRSAHDDALAFRAGAPEPLSRSPVA